MKILRSKRKLINRNENQVSWLQIIGFLMIVAGILYLVFNMFFLGISAEEVAIIFFDIMLGVAFAFPDMLKDESRQVSTMRIVVFMIVNVLCMLLLKIGWDKPSFEAIGINGYWMGIIGFLFGAKAAQSYFESKLAVPRADENKKDDETDTSENINENKTTAEIYSDQAIIKMAIKQCAVKHLEGVVGVGRGFRTVNGTREMCLQINTADEKYVEVLSKPMDVDLGNGESRRIVPKVLVVGESFTSSGASGSGITNIGGSNGNGTFGCVVVDNTTKAKHLLSCQHVLNHDFKYDNVSDPVDIAFVSNPHVGFASHISGFRTSEIDAGLAAINGNAGAFNNSKLGKVKGTRNLTLDDLDETVEVTIIGFDEASSQNGFVAKKTGVIFNNEFSTTLKYPDGKSFGLDDLIVLGEKTATGSKTISKPGYSGSLVVDEDHFAIGLLVGGDSLFSYAIPINKVLRVLDCSILKS